MTPSEPKPAAPGAQKTDLPVDTWSGTELPANLPDPAVLARMATEFFTALPGAAQFAGSFPAGEAPSSAIAAESAPAAPANATALTEADFIDAISTLGSGSDRSALSPSLVPPIPAIPGASLPEFPGQLGFAGLTVPTSFSFLKDARPLFTDTAAPARSSPQPQPAPAKGPAKEPSPAYGGIPTAIPLSGAENFGAPLVPGSWQRPDATGQPTFDRFLEGIRQLTSVDVVPVVEPLRSEAVSMPDLDLSSRPFEIGEIRRDFPILRERVNGRPLVWLDNAATTQKPQAVIDRLTYFYTHENSNVHRAAHELAARATDAYEGARAKVRRFVNASNAREIVFVRGATEGINLVAQSWGRQSIQKDDEIVITWLEHHANIVPWQMLCKEKGARLRVAPVDDSGQILLDEYAKLLGPRTRLVAFAQVSNALGTVTPAKRMIELAHRYGAKVLIDGAQAVSHMQTDVQSLDCDFYVFSGHKVFAPTGIGAVYGKLDILEHTQPWQGGGSMISDVTFEKTVYSDPPQRFEAGTGSIADAVGLGAAIDYIERIGMYNISRYEHDLLGYAIDALQTVPGLHLIGTAKEKTSVLSFVVDGFRNEDVGTALNAAGIAVRAGHHCAQPIHRRFGLESSVRASLALYNTCEDVDALVAALWNLTQGRAGGMV
ncbi:MAG: family 2A encapsulin nanocompartment cargo protein cysteine desulfurase [Candidatus Acidiferrales bacterium]|jgi:cysteine desulfurase/selenocysteine lyase